MYPVHMFSLFVVLRHLDLLSLLLVGLVGVRNYVGSSFSQWAAQRDLNPCSFGVEPSALLTAKK